MSDEHGEDGPERFRQYVEAKQRNIDWPVRYAIVPGSMLFRGRARRG